MAKITNIQVTPLMLPRVIPRGMEDKVGDKWVLPVVVTRLRTDSGAEGLGYTLALAPDYIRSLTTIVQDLSELFIGQDVFRAEQALAQFINRENAIGPGGLLNLGVAALDIGMWDLQGILLEQPLWRMLGGYSDRIKVYDSSLIAQDIDLLQQSAADALARGYRAMKMRPGPDRYGPAEGVKRRVKAVRDVIGYDVDLMYDVNQTWTPSRAIRMGHALEEYELAWIEDPTLMHDIRGQAEIAAALDTPICSGEYHYDAPPLLRLLQEGAVDYLMVDLMRQGGITQFRKVAAVAEAFGVPVASHVVPEVFAHCIAAIPNGLIVEGMPVTQRIFQGLPELADGELVLSERPGHGLMLDQEAFARYMAG